MKFTAVLLLYSTIIASAVAHVGLGWPIPHGGYGTKEFDSRIVNPIGDRMIDPALQEYPCGGYKFGPVTNLKAGEVVPVRFWVPGIKDTTRLPTTKMTQIRHGGGYCEMSLSRDGGKSFQVIGSYSYSCPDIYYEWPVRIPRTIPDCKDPDMCLFAWSWTAKFVPQFYHNCASVTISGVENGKWPTQPIGLWNFGDHLNKTFPGDGHTGGNGPDKQEIARNLA